MGAGHALTLPLPAMSDDSIVEEYLSKRVGNTHG
jgi:hypothetical protein